MSILKTTNAGRLSYLENELIKRGYHKSTYIDFFGGGVESAEVRFYYTFNPDMDEKNKTNFCMYVYYYLDEENPVFRFLVRMNYSNNPKVKNHRLGEELKDFDFLKKLEVYWNALYKIQHPKNKIDVELGTITAKNFERKYIEDNTNIEYDV